MDIIDKDHWWMQPQSLKAILEEFRFQFTRFDFDGDSNDIYTAAAA